LGSVLVANAASFTADSARGERLFESLASIQCHSVNGTGGSSAPDLGRMLDRGFTPALLAATMWNHAPAMWASMREHQIQAGDLDQQAAQDLMAFFYGARFFEQPGDAGRGKRAFGRHGCARCHTLPLSQWQGLTDPIGLIDAMWNHRSQMLGATASKRVPFPPLRAPELTDMLVYLRNQPGTRARAGVFRVETVGSGEDVFHAAGCAHCHQTVEALADRVEGQTLTEIAIEMWNHAPRMAAAGAPGAPLAAGDMQALVGSFWAARFFGAAGRPSPGRRVFVTKNCAACHNDASSGAPQLPRRGAQVQRLGHGLGAREAWAEHGGSNENQGIAWPRFEGTQMADLIAYLNHP
jgi:cytochrome c2